MSVPIYALIMAGGTGSRLWPRSRTLHPKQFLDLTGELTMLQQSQQRLIPLIPPERTLVATNQNYVEIVARQLPELQPENILGEPVGRGTAAAIGLAAIVLRRRDPHGIMAVLTADHLIKKTEVFRKVLEVASLVASDDWLVTLGIKPSYPETGYGYIERGESLGKIRDFEAYRVQRFVEKPGLSKAEKYLESGNYSWNSGMFIWKVSRILEEMEIHMPDLYLGLLEIEHMLGTSSENEILDRVFPGLPHKTVDYGIMEKADRVAVLPVDIGWNDVGSWSAVYDVLPRDQANNVVVGRHVSTDTRNSLIYSPNRLVATIGMEDVVIVDTDDVLLVCPRSRSQEVKKIVNTLKSNGESNYLHGASPPAPLSNEQVSHLFRVASTLEKVLLSFLIHAGIWPSEIIQLATEQFDLVLGWVNTPSGKRPIPDTTRKLIYEWLKERDSLQFDFGNEWESSDSLKQVVDEIGKKAGVSVTVDRIYETLARAIFSISEEGKVIQNLLGEEVGLLKVPLHTLFPFSFDDFAGHEEDALGSRAHDVLNKATTVMDIN